MKQPRRLSVGRYVALTFENRDTVIFQIQEMMRAERTVKEEIIVDELEIYNEMIPDAGELSATLFIEVADESKIKPIMDRFFGIDHGQTVSIRFGPERVHALFETGHSDESQISAVHFVRFPFTPAPSRRFRSAEDAAFLHISHGTYRTKAPLPPEMRRSLIADLAS